MIIDALEAFSRRVLHERRESIRALSLRRRAGRASTAASRRLLNHLARRIKSEGSRECYLSWLYRFCRKIGKDPDEIVAMEPPWIFE
jgi:hypothetical protein